MNKLTILLLASAIASVASADVTLSLGTTINGDTPIGGPDYLTALLQDVSANTVRLTLSNNMRSDHFVPSVLLNVNTSAPLSFQYVSGQAATSIEKSSDAFNGGSSVKGGLFDILISYAVSQSGGNRFAGGEKSVYLITGTGLRSSSFLTQSVSDGKVTGGLFGAARVQGIGEGSGSIGAPVPEPATMLALGLGAAAMLRRRRRA